MANRQTVWLSTMMILSLMVIGYYTVDDTLKPVPTASTDKSKSNDQQPKDAKKDPGKSQQDPGKSADKTKSSASSGWFDQQFVKREQDYSQKMEQLQHVMADSKTANDDKVKAEQELKALSEFYNKASDTEDKLTAEGYAEALITKDNNRVTVTVQVAELSKEQAAKIYTIVSQELNIPANQIVVSYKQ